MQNRGMLRTTTGSRRRWHPELFQRRPVRVVPVVRRHLDGGLDRREVKVRRRSRPVQLASDWWDERVTITDITDITVNGVDGCGCAWCRPPGERPPGLASTTIPSTAEEPPAPQFPFIQDLTPDSRVQQNFRPIRESGSNHLDWSISARLRTLFVFVLLILLAGATSATAASKEVSRQSATELGVQATINAPVTICQCNWYFCNKGSVEGTAAVICKTTGHFENGSTGRWDLILDESSFVVGFRPGSTGATVPDCQDLF